MTEFQRELRSLLNKHSLENVSNTPDLVLARFLVDCLASFNNAVRIRDDWYGRDADAGPKTTATVAKNATPTTEVGVD